MADVLLTELSDGLMAVAKTMPLKANTRTQANKVAAALISAMPGQASMRGGLILGEAQKALIAQDPEGVEGVDWEFATNDTAEQYTGSGPSLGTAARALLTDIES
jgi:hypothetical protein